MNRLRSTAQVLVLALGLASAAFAQAEPMKPRMWWVHEEHVKPSMLAQYEAASRDFRQMVSDNRAAMPTFGYTAFAGADFVYTYLAPIGNLAGGDTIRAEFDALGRAAGARMGEVMGRNGAATESFDDWIILERPDLSYVPATPRLKPEEMGWANADFYYILPGREMEIPALSTEFQALWKAKGIQNGWTYYEAISGEGLPLIVIRSDAKDAADWAAADAKDLATVGAEGQALFAKAMAMTRKFERRSGTLRRDLSLMPPMASWMPKK